MVSDVVLVGVKILMSMYKQPRYCLLKLMNGNRKMTLRLEVKRHDGINIDLLMEITSIHITALRLLLGLPISHRIAIN